MLIYQLESGIVADYATKELAKYRFYVNSWGRAKIE